MISVHVVSAKNKHLYNATFDEYFKKRYEVFIEERGWTDLPFKNGLEVDQYDDRHAVYLLALDQGRVIGGQRFYPTTRPHMLSEIFPYLSQWPLPQGSDTWECTRYFVTRERRQGRTDARLMLAMQQFCLEEGISHITGVMEMASLSSRLQAGLKVRPLGLPQTIGGEPTIAVVADITPDSYALMLERLGARPTALIRQGIGVGFVDELEYAAA